MDELNRSAGFGQSADLTELIDFLNDQWERRDPMDELSEDLGAFLQEGGILAKPLSELMSANRSMPNFSIC